MKNNLARVLIASLVLTTLVVAPLEQHACGPWFPVAIFSYSAHPDLPLKAYASGELGILQPTYWRKYLYIAYRNLHGPGFSPTEIKILTTEQPQETVRPAAEMAATQTPARTWYETRKHIPSLPLPQYIQSFTTQIPGYRENPWEFYGYENCLTNSYETAATTLQKRVQQFGAASPEVRSWVEAQDKVFAHCGGWWAMKTIDAPAPEDAMPTEHPLIRADRAYQIAAADFYAKKFDDARARFEQIAADETSPWREIAPLLVARCFIRKATLIEPEGPREGATLQLAQAQLEKILRDPERRKLHKPAEDLLGFVRAKLNPRERLHEIGANLMRPNIQTTIKQDLTDFTYLLDRIASVDVDGDDSEPYEKAKERATAKKYEALGTLQSGQDLLDWVLTFQSPGSTALKHSVERWRKTNTSPWLVAALTKVSAGSPEVTELLAAAEKIPQDSPAFTSVQFHRLRLLAEEGKTGAVRSELDKLLKNGSAKLPRSALNLFLALRLKVAQNLDEFLRFAPRIPATTTFNEDGSEYPGSVNAFEWGGARAIRWKELLTGKSAFDSDAAVALSERMPLRLLSRSAKSTFLPAGLRREVAVAAWVKANLLGNDSFAAELTPMLAELAPELKGNLDSYQAAKTSNERRFAAVFTILHFPGMRPQIDAGVGRDIPFAKIDSYRDNWWCAFAQHNEGAEYSGQGDSPRRAMQLLYRDGRFGVPTFLSPQDRVLAEREWTKQRALPSAPNYLSKVVIEWAKRHPDDPRVPEALHLAVRSTRYGCTDDNTSKFSKAAFLLLHQKYSKSEWAKKTKYWY